MVRRKDFASGAPAAGGSGAGDGDAGADAEEKWVAALARAVVPAAIAVFRSFPAHAVPHPQPPIVLAEKGVAALTIVPGQLDFLDYGAVRAAGSTARTAVTRVVTSC